MINEYTGNWLALGACIYGGKTADAALSVLGLRKAIKRKSNRDDIDTSMLISLRKQCLTLREIASECGASFCLVRKRLLAAGVNLERRQR